MTVSGTAAEIGFAPQAAGKFGNGTFTPPGGLTWRRIRALDVQLAPTQLEDQLPLETGSVPTPTGFYKGGTFFGGNVRILPRTLNVMGLLFYAAMGNVSTVANKDMDGNTATGVFTHIFNFNANNTVPWFSVRRKIPGQTGSDELGEYGIDCQVNAFRIQASAIGKIQMDMSIIGRRPQWESGPLVWSWSNTLEDGQSIPESLNGTLKWGSVSPTQLDMDVMIANNLTLSNPQNEFIIGSPYPDDSITISRMVRLGGTLKYKDPTLYKQFFTGGVGSNSWSSAPTLFATDASNYAFNAVFLSPLQIGTTGKYYGMALRGNSMSVSASPIRLRPGQMVTQEINALIQTPTSGDYFQIVLQNDQASYTWS